MPVQFLINLLQRNVQIKIVFKIKITRNLSIFGIHTKKEQVKPIDDFIIVFFYFKNVSTSDDCIIDWILYLLRCLYTLFHVILVTCRLVHETLLRYTNEKKNNQEKPLTIFFKKIAANNWIRIHVSLWTNYLLSIHQN